ncbi:MAG: Putative 4,5-dihydroxyphthalate dehydrogenase [Candidatus Moanabacter tarae]|uniref:4,5-dihydroxyphthalate dehydrogenase n=1 Tax=Candidatus Moanibacter tarae TaxID=2200854 RepID=A0A2Z4AB02_9BACT|nr:MAG: Putative 4,5-dihydroxyphthalate dehydrogenase [Candidatus Moanabacter tarae]
MKKTRVGIIGCGGMAQSHTSRFLDILDRIEVTAVVDINKERAQSVADLLPNKPIVETNFQAIYAHIDAALVVVPHHLHHSVSIDCLRAGKHVLVEKPMALNETECLELIKESKNQNRILMVAYCMRFHPLIIRMKELIDTKTYGELFQLSIWTEQLTLAPKGHWRSSAATLGGGQFFSHGCHYVDLMLWIAGQPIRGSHYGTRRGTPWMEREGTSNLTIEFENGVLGYHFGTWGARGTRLKYSFHAHCENGMLEIALRDGQLIAHTRAEEHNSGKLIVSQQEKVLLESENTKPTEIELAHFIDCIETGAKPLTDPVSSLEGLKVIWKLYEAEARNEIANLKGLGLGTTTD